LENAMLLLTLKRQDCVKRFRCWKTELNTVWIRNRNQNFSEVGTGTATNHYGSTTLQVGKYRFQVLYPDEEGGQVEEGGEEPEQGQAKLEIQS
jgi:hypothetical protein